MFGPYPRYRELLDQRALNDTGPSPRSWTSRFSDDDVHDLLEVESFRRHGPVEMEVPDGEVPGEKLDGVSRSPGT